MAYNITQADRDRRRQLAHWLNTDPEIQAKLATPESRERRRASQNARWMSSESRARVGRAISASWDDLPVAELRVAGIRAAKGMDLTPRAVDVPVWVEDKLGPVGAAIYVRWARCRSEDYAARWAREEVAKLRGA